MYYLGYPAKILIENSTDYNGIISARLKNISAFVIAQVDALISLIESTRTKLDNTRDDGNVSGVGDISLDPSMTDLYIKKQYNRYINELGTMLGIAPMLGGNTVSIRW